ncbi:DUF4189 domain-containing protein [Streptomyces sp. JV185]|uniref:DUF4189 domain-containing protein n=1 Tax=Streptomyces sp. JV185 TaxID=858638 RepID=UPI002E7965BF|nr:DUF4189 domain-containing protein [Streptomyces sp. JV185]MEE1772776.1 DUF4189 domain-containing protein [Streptomyces sp. JV185]
MKVPWVRPDQLGPYAAHRLGDGGQGIVYGVPRAPGKLSGQLAYKEYRPQVRPDPAALQALAASLSTLDPADQSFLSERLAWPIAIVYTGSAPSQLPLPANSGTSVVGFLMQRVGNEFELNSTAIGGVKQQGLEFLLNPETFLQTIGLTLDDRTRLDLLTDLASTLSRLHKGGVVVGDLSPKNVLFTLDGAPRVLLIDCDSMRYRTQDVLPQVETTGWSVPESAKATPASDTYKFGLIAARIFNQDQVSTDLGPLRGVAPELADLAQRSTRSDPARRPALAEWLHPLEQARKRTQPGKRTKVKAPKPPTPRPARPAAPRHVRPTAPRPVRPAVPTSPGAGTGPAGNPGGKSSGRTAAGVVAAVVGVILVSALAHGHSTAGDDSGSSAFPTVSAPPYVPDEPADDDPTVDPVVPVVPVDTATEDPSTEEPDPDPSSETPDPDPLTDDPAPETTQAPAPPPAPAPRPNYYGAIAVARNGAYGRAWDHRTASAARQGALNSCPGSCKVLVTFANGCGAVAYNPNAHRYWGGHGASRTEAESSAISHAGGGYWITAVCTTRYTS